MTTQQLKKKLIKQIKELPKEELKEVIEFIEKIREKGSKKSQDNLTYDLSQLSTSQAAHLEEEFKNYKTLYPRE